MHALTEAAAARFRISLTYLWRHGRWPDLARPTLFTELVQTTKLHVRDPRMPLLADKVAVKAEVAAALGREWVVPMLWSGTELPGTMPFAHPVVVKARHGCRQNAFVSTQAEWHGARRRAAGWMRHTYGLWLDEWLYTQIPRGLLIEPRIGDPQCLPTDYKVFVFGGQATHVQVHLDRAGTHRWMVHDRDFRPLRPGEPPMPRPSALQAMFAAAETLARGFDYARVDFYQPGNQPLFGEITFYPGSGLDPFDPPHLDAELGALWLDAIAGPPAGALPRPAHAKAG